jgi:hypothetical protein
MGTKTIQRPGGDPATAGNQNWPQAAATPQAALDGPWIPGGGSDVGWNDDFDSGSPDFALRGWTVVRWSDGVPMTRAGDVSWVQGRIPATRTYFSTIVGSRIFVQTPAGEGLFVYKTFASAPYLFGARGSFPYLENGYFFRMFVYNAPRDATNPERSAFGTGCYGSGTNVGHNQFIFTNAAGAQSYNTDGGSSFGTDDRAFDTFTCELRSPNNVAHASWDLDKLNQRWREAYHLPGVSSSAVACGVHLQTASATAAGSTGGNTCPNALALDWIRRAPVPAY